MIHLFVINPVSFPREKDLERITAEIESCFSEEEAGSYFLHVSRYPRDAAVIIRKYLMTIPKTETVRVYAVGGDGILFDCLNGIVGLPNTELASIPWGNANDFVRAFGEGKNGLFRDIRLQKESPAIPVDLIHCGSRYALNYCTVGLESRAAMTSVMLYSLVRGKIRKYRRLSFLVYTLLFYLSGAKAVMNRRILNQRYAITADGEDMSGVYGTINIANGPCYGADKNPVVTAMPDDGTLDAMFFNCPSRLKAASLIGPYLRGDCFRLSKKYFTWKRLRQIGIRSEEPLLVNLDGETFFDTAVTVEIIPSGVKFVAPGGIGFCKRINADEHNR
jgi:diacylglycerol kinase family enzyme